MKIVDVKWHKRKGRIVKRHKRKVTGIVIPNIPGQSKSKGKRMLDLSANPGGEGYLGLGTYSSDG